MSFKNTFCLLFLIHFASSAFTQVESIEEFVFDFTPVFQSKELTYYGADFSEFRFSYPNKVGTEESMIKFIPAWMADFNQIYTLNVLPRLLKKKVNGNLQTIQNTYKEIEPEWILFEPRVLILDDIKSHVQKYQLEEKSGVGLVLIVEHFDKNTETGIVYFTLFDVATKEIYYINKMKGVAIGAGMSNHWANVLSSSFDVFITSYRELVHQAKKNSKRSKT